MKSSPFVCRQLALFFLLLVASSLSVDAISPLAQKLIVRRQSGETEKESNTNDDNNSNNNNSPSSMQPPARLYPDLPQQPGQTSQGLYPAVGPQGAFQPNFHGAPTPFVPFSPQLTPSQLSDLQRRMQPPMMRPPMSSSDRLQSQTFTNGLGRRLLSMIGLDQENAAAAAGNETNPGASADPSSIMKALQNATVLQQLNGGVQSIYGSLSKMYNSTVQQQLMMLQEKFKRETENSTNPWQQRMTQQVPMFFKGVAAKVGEAQENLNRIWQQMLAQASSVNGPMPAGNGGIERSAAAGGANSGNLFSSFDRFMSNPNGASNSPDGMFAGSGSGNGENFLDQFGRSFGFNAGGQQQPAAGTGQNGLGSQLMAFWHNQVQPQIGMVRGQMARVWRDLTASGALMGPDPTMMRSRNNNFNSLAGGAPSSQGENSSLSTSPSELVGEILKEVDMNNSEYTILDPKIASGDQQQPRQSNISSQMQNRLMTMQRELNQLWSGLTNSLQNAIGNVRNTLTPPAQQFGPMATNDNKQEADPEENEISGKVNDLGKLQREADTVHEVLQQQQHQQQQRPNFGDRFRSFFNNVDLANEFNQLPNRFGNSINRFGTAVGDLWNQIPRRWDNFMENMGPQSDMAKARLVAATSPATVANRTATETSS